MHTIYLLCFVIGLLLSIGLALVGNLGSHHPGMPDQHAGGHHAGGHGAHGGSHGSSSSGHHASGGGHHAHAGGHHAADLAQSILGFALGFLSPISLGGAAMLFGGVGLLLGSSTLALPVAIVAGVIGALGLRLLLSAFVSASTPPLSLGAEGAIATVNATIRPDAPGEVVYTLEGLHRSMAARSTNGHVIPRGTQVVITQRERGMAWVEPLDPLDTEQGE